MPKEYGTAEWDQLQQHLLSNWKQGEHVTIIGPTGCGKTTLESRALGARDYVVVLVSKIHDDTLSKQFPGFTRIEKWPPRFHEDKVLLWPRVDKCKTIREVYQKQHDVFKDALDHIFKERNWCVVFDEQHYLCTKLGLQPENEMFLHQGRSSGLSIVNGAQRPAWVPLVTYSSATHAFIYNTNTRSDFKRLADMGGTDTLELEYNIRQLSKHEFVYVNTRTGDLIRSQVKL